MTLAGLAKHLAYVEDDRFGRGLHDEPHEEPDEERRAWVDWAQNRMGRGSLPGRTPQRHSAPCGRSRYPSSDRRGEGLHGRRAWLQGTEELAGRQITQPPLGTHPHDRGVSMPQRSRRASA